MKRLRALSLLAALLAAPAPAADKASAPAHCVEEYAECREDCVMSYGTSLKVRPQFARCITKCEKAGSACRERHFEAQRGGLAPSDPEKPSQVERAEEPTQPPREPEPEELPKRTATRVSDLEPEGPKPAPAAEEPAKPKEEPPAAKPPPAPEKPPPEKPKPAEKKPRPLDEWDPDAL